MTFRGIDQFNKEMKAFSRKQIPEVVQAVQTKIVLDVLTGAVELTPVDTGRARGGWQVSVGSLPGPNKRKDKSGNSVIASGTSKAAFAPPYSLIFISNSVEYIEVLEYGKYEPANPGPSSIRFKSGRKIPGKTGQTLIQNGYHVQAPQGMLSIATQAAISKAIREFRDLRAG